MSTADKETSSQTSIQPATAETNITIISHYQETKNEV
jgi:hypothetical protein